VQVVSTEHLAEILIGIARAQAAIVLAMEKNGRVVQALEAQLRSHPEKDALAGLPARLLLASLGPAGPNSAELAQELERLCAGPEEPPSPMDQRPTDFNP